MGNDNRHYPQRLSISFKRTVRVADNGDTNDLPPDLGAFPVYQSSKYAGRLPDHLSRKGGFFIPVSRLGVTALMMQFANECSVPH